MDIFKKTAGFLTDIVFPRRCPVCDEPLPTGDYICRDCFDSLKTIGGHFCLKCGRGLKDKRREYCDDCTRIKHHYIAGRAMYEYPVIRDSLFRFKYSGRREYAGFYALHTARVLGNTIRTWKPDALIPVPIHKDRERKRGYNQAYVYARALGRELSIPVKDDIIKRVRNTVVMKKLDVRRRDNNLKNAFKIEADVVKLESIVLVDDIYTTGSTIDAMALEFSRHGISEVYYIALAIGRT